jgi:hypothetical protein
MKTLAGAAQANRAKTRPEEAVAAGDRGFSRQATRAAVTPQPFPCNLWALLLLSDRCGAYDGGRAATGALHAARPLLFRAPEVRGNGAPGPRSNDS